ncbi:MAG: Gfo/Idh/MocA family protein [Acidimicrobiales bacterium]
MVGCGYWGSKHVRVLPSIRGVDRVVAIDRDQRILDALANRYSCAEYSQSLSDVVDRLDALVVASPPRTHAPMARAALEAGCHVLVEKPLATSVAEAQELVALASRRNLVLMSGHTFEYNPAVWKLRDLIQQGELGQIFHVNTARLNLGLYQGDVDVLWDLAPHDVSILNYILDSRPSSVSAWAGAHAHRQVKDVAYLRLHFDELGLVAQVHVSWLDPCKVRRVTVVGSRKMAVYDDLAEDERIKVFDKGVALDSVHHGLGAGGAIDIGRRPAAYRQGGIECPYIEFEEPLVVENRSFVESIRNGVEPPSTGRSGLAVVQILTAAERSLTTGQPVDVDYGVGTIGPGAPTIRRGAGTATATGNGSMGRRSWP